MLTLIHRFAALVLVCGVLMAVLPEGSVRRTAAMVMGLIVALCWLEGLSGLFHWPMPAQAPATVLSSAPVNPGDLSAAQTVYARQLQRAQEAR